MIFSRLNTRSLLGFNLCILSLGCLKNLVYKLVEKLPEFGQRFSLVEKILHNAELFPFVTQFFEYITSDEQEWISSDQKKLLGQIVANKITLYFAERSIFEHDKFNRSLIRVLIQFGIKEQNYNLFEREINNNPINASRLVSCFSIGSFKYDFNSLDRLIDNKTVYDAIQKKNDLDKLDINDISLQEGQLSPSIPKSSDQAFLEWCRQKEL
jgi:hypothetical protein